MPASDGCGICGGPLDLRFPGSSTPVTAAHLSPTCHEPGAHRDLYVCRACGTIQQPELPRGTALVDLYRDMRDDAYLAQERGRRATARRLLDLIAREQPATRRLLDVGCGPGLLLDEARARGWEARGLEPSAASRSHAVGRGLDVLDATLEDLDATLERPYDAIVLADVLEHFDDPAAALRRCAALLADDGCLLVVTPDPSSATARLAGARWWGLLPAHTFLLPRRTLRGVLEQAGFDVVRDTSLWRSFTIAYWLDGLGERSGIAGRIAGAIRRAAPERPLLTLSLGDERVMLARRAASHSVSIPAAAARPSFAAPTPAG